MISILCDSTITPEDLLCLRGASHTLRFILGSQRVNDLVERFIRRSARWILPNEVDWWDVGGYEEWDVLEQESEQTDPEFFELDGEKIRIQRQRKRKHRAEDLERMEFRGRRRVRIRFLLPMAGLLPAVNINSTLKMGRETSYAYSSSIRNRKRVVHIVGNIKKLIEEVEIDPEKGMNTSSIDEYRKKNVEGKERFKAWPSGTPKPMNAKFLTY